MQKNVSEFELAMKERKKLFSTGELWIRMTVCRRNHTLSDYQPQLTAGIIHIDISRL
jgi:hypothetical protein